MTYSWEHCDDNLARCLNEFKEDSIQPHPFQNSKSYFPSPIPSYYQPYEPQYASNFEYYYSDIGHNPYYCRYDKRYKYMGESSGIHTQDSSMNNNHPAKLQTHFSANNFQSSAFTSIETQKKKFVEATNDRDVLCGRGAPTSWHPGNKFFRRLVKEHQKEYLASRRSDKPLVAMKLLEEIRARGGRFLKRNKIVGITNRGRFVWVEISEQQAYEKACQALREGAPNIRRRMQSSKPSSI